MSDPNGNLTSKTDAHSITYTYDALNWNTGVTYSTYPNGSVGAVIALRQHGPSKFGKGMSWYN
ncbi:MAG: RHS repeat protein [Acidobacteria bacterium]|nr:RHS repeat protein [Acidobacteriota bacterium]